jgi:hypothetical protein
MTTAIDVTPIPEYNKSGDEVFDFDDSTLVDDSIQQLQFVKSFNLTGPNLPDQEYYMYQQNDLMSLYLWSRSFLKLSFTVVRNGTDTAGLSSLTSDARTLFRRIRCLLGGQVLFDLPEYFWLYATQDYAWWTENYLNTVGSGFFVNPDNNKQPGVGQHSGSVWRYAGSPAGSVGLTRDNSRMTGMANQASYSPGLEPIGNVVSCFIPLYHLIPALQYMDKCIQGLQFQLELWKSDSPIHINTINPDGTSTIGSIVWANAPELWCRRVTPTSTYKLLLQEKMNRGLDFTVKYPMPNVYRYDADPNTTSNELNIAVTASRPLHMIVLFQRKSATTNPAVPTDYFSHFSITSMSAYTNGIKTPQEGINQVIDEDKNYADPPPYVRKENTAEFSNSYYWYLKHCGQFKAPYLNNFQDGTGTLSLIDWKNKMPIYSFDLSTREIGSWAGGASQINLRYERNTNAWEEDCYMYCLLWTESTLGIHLENFNNYCTNT